VRKLQLGITILIIGLVLSGWKLRIKYESKVAPLVKQHHLQYFQTFQDEVDALATLTSRSNGVIIDSLHVQHLATRQAYKRVEFFFDYIHTKFAYLNINGGPLLKIDDDYPDRDPINPNGLQTLDELIYSGEPELDLVLIDSLAQALKEAVRLVNEPHKASQFVDHMIIEAIRSGLVRILTLGVTGFDTPGSGQGLPEAEISLLVMQEAFSFFNESLLPEAQTKYNQILRLFDLGVDQLHTQTFEDFDRFHFLNSVINPLYASLHEFVLLNNISDKTFKNHAHNYTSINLFDEEFLNKSYFQEFSYAILEDPKRIALGKILFYDPILSKNMAMSCASCHVPDKAFSDGLVSSRANTPGKFTSRNSPTLIDATFSKKYFHDLRSANLERQIPHVFENKDEFDMSFAQVIKRLKQSEEYKKYFKEAYPGIAVRNDINQRSISNALAAYVNTLVSFDSDFDKFVRGEQTKYPQSAKRGFNLFMGKAACGTCHFPPAFNGTVPPFYTESESEVLGVTIGFDTLQPILDLDLGRYANGRMWENRPHFKHSFKTPGLRNIELTGPYMHNGTFDSLEEVMEFYNRGGGAGLGLNIDNQTLAPDALNLSDEEQQDIISFLHTLTDTTGLHPGQVSLPKFNNNPTWNRRSAQ